MKSKEVRNLSDAELVSKLNDARQEYMNLRFQVVNGQLTDFNRLRISRRNIARFETILHERQQAGKEGNS